MSINPFSGNFKKEKIQNKADAAATLGKMFITGGDGKKWEAAKDEFRKST